MFVKASLSDTAAQQAAMMRYASRQASSASIRLTIILTGMTSSFH